MRASLLAAALLGLAGVSVASSLDPRVLRPVEARVIAISEASGPPEQSCDEARALSAKLDKPLVKPTPAPKVSVATSSSSEPDYSQMKKVMVGGTAKAPAELPGHDPELLPLQPLEGKALDVAAAGDVLRAALAGEPVRITFFGASHVGGDFFTGHVRRVLQGRYGDRGHGFLLPAALYEGWRGHDVNLCRSDLWFGDYAGKRDGRGDGLLGLAGMSVSSSDPAQFGWVETTKSNNQGRAVSRYDIFTLGQPGGGTLRASVDGVERELPTAAGAHELQRWRLSVPDGPHRLVVSPKGDGEVRIFGVSAEREVPGVIVDSMGVKGKTAKTWLSWDRKMAAEGLLALDPDLVVLAYGTNEAADTGYTMDEYRQDLRQVLFELRRVLPDRACVLVGPSDRAVKVNSSTYAVWDRTDDVAQVQRELAPEYGCTFWDMQQASGGEGSMIAWRLHQPALAAADLIHFSQKGYEKLADRFIAALDVAATGGGF